MDMNRIQREFSEAQKTFAYVELHPTADGKVYARTALQTASGMYVVSIKFPESYPNEMPRVFVDTPPIIEAPHRYQGGAHLLFASFDVESWCAPPDICDRARGEVVEQI